MHASRPKDKNGSALFQVASELLPYVRPYRFSVVLSVILVLLRVGFDVLQPWPLKIIIDDVLTRHPVLIKLGPFATVDLSGLSQGMLLLLACAVMFVLSLLAGGFSYLAASRITSIGQCITYDVRKALFDHIQRLSLSYYEKERSGDILSRVSSDVSNIQDLLVSTVNVLFVNSLLVAGILVVMIRVDLRLTLVALGLVPALFFLIRHYMARIKTAQRRAKRKEGEIASLVQEAISLIRIVQAFGREKHETARFEVPACAAKEAGTLATEMQSRFNPLVELTTGLGTILIVFVGARLVISGAMSLGTLIVFMAYLRAIYSPVRELARLTNVLSKATVSAERIQEVLKTPLGITDVPGAIDAPALRGHVRFDQVSFSYKVSDMAWSDRPEVVLHGVNFEVQPGMKVALVGRTGSGKTTLVNLLLRFYSPLQGSILIDGFDIKSLKVSSLRHQISVVPQEAVLMRATIWENIAYGCQGFPPGFGPEWLRAQRDSKRVGGLMERITQAAIDSYAHEFILRLPEGYNTVVGERGGTLSGGQRQRIAIARAMIRDAPILILDEPTTGLDAEAELSVLKALERLCQGRTTFMITHNLRTIRNADLILVIEGGKIVEAGTHSELYGTGRRYRSFCELQLTGPGLFQSASS